MISYFDISTFHFGPLAIHTWGFFVSIGFVAALWVAYCRARRVALDGNAILDLGFWILICAFLGARLFHVFFYEWNYYRVHLVEIIRIDQGGLSSFGGFIGATVGFLVYGKLRLHNAPQPPLTLRGGGVLRYADVLMFAWPLGHAIGRVGCFLTHMHPGRLSNSVWAVQYPGGARLDMGLIESAVLFTYWVIIFFATRKRRMFDGFYLVSGMIFYGAARFILDFFRASDLPMADTRYAGLTPAQYGSIVLIAMGIVFFQKLRACKHVV